MRRTDGSGSLNLERVPSAPIKGHALAGTAHAVPSRSRPSVSNDNDEHRHSAIGFVTPNQRHAGQDMALLENRAVVYEMARQANPQSWSKQTRDRSYVCQVNFNPQTPNLKEADAYKEAAQFNTLTRQLA